MSKRCAAQCKDSRSCTVVIGSSHTVKVGPSSFQVTLKYERIKTSHGRHGSLVECRLGDTLI